MKNFSLSFSAFILSIILSSPIQSQTFQKVYDLGSDDYINMSTVDANGGIISVGSSTYVGAGGFDAILSKVDSTGNFLWEKQYGGSGTEFGTALAATSSGFAIAGRSSSFTGGDLDISLIKTDNNGDLQWAKTYGTDSAEYATYVSATYDGGFIITGETRSLGHGGLDLFLLKTDATGAVEWFNTYGSIGNESGNQVVQTSDSGYFAIGYSGFGGAGLNDIYLVKTNSAGVTEGQLLIGGTGDDVGKRMLDMNNGAIITGTTRASVTNSQDDIFVAELNFSGGPPSITWYKTYGSTVNNDAPTNIIPFPQGGYAFSGNTQSFGSFFEGLLFLVDPTGVYQGGLTYEGSGDVFAQDVLVNNTDVIITGFTSAFGGTASDLYLIKFPGDPNSTCLREDVALTETSVTPSLAFASFTALPLSVTATTVTFTQSSATATETDVCSNLPLTADAGNDKSYCTGGGTQIGGNPAATGGTEPYSFSWTPSTGLSNPNDPNTNASPSSTTTYTMTVTDSLGATATDQVTVIVDPLPIAVINPPGPNICEGQNVTLTASGGISYSWSTGDTTAAIVEFPSAASTSYSVTVTNNCGNTATATEIVTSHTRPTVTVTPNNPTICDTSSTGVTLHASGAETYVWTPSTGLSSDTSSNPVAIPIATTTYSVTGKNGHCAGNNPTTVTVTVDVCLGVKDVLQSIANIFPNPAKDVVNINISAEGYSEGLLSIIAMDGKIAFENKLSLNVGMNTISVNTPDLKSGFYFVRIKTEKTISIGKAIIE